jgi:hypothetical protein
LYFTRPLKKPERDYQYYDFSGGGYSPSDSHSGGDSGHCGSDGGSSDGGACDGGEGH